MKTHLLWILLPLGLFLACEETDVDNDDPIYFDVPSSWLSDASTLDQGAAGEGGGEAGEAGGGAPVIDAGPIVDAEPLEVDAEPLEVDAEPMEVDAEPIQGEVTRVRIMAANITSGNGQSYEGPGIRIIQGLNPDIVLIQEFNYDNDSDADIRELVREARGAEFSYYREPRGTIPNGIISRWPITLAGSENDPEVNNRNFAWARIEIPGHRHLWAFSLHLLTSSSSDRNSEGRALVNFIRGRVPDGDFLVIGGDLNTSRSSESVIETLSQVVSTSFTPMDQRGNRDTNASRSKPYDWVLANNELNAFHTPLIIGNSTYPQGLVFDSRVYTPLSEVAPARQGDSGASNMQHMAVVKDFELRP